MNKIVYVVVMDVYYEYSEAVGVFENKEDAIAFAEKEYPNSYHIKELELNKGILSKDA